MSLNKPEVLMLKGKKFHVPDFVPSISGASKSIATVSDIKTIFQALQTTKVSSAMISVYDLIREKSHFGAYYKKIVDEGITIHDSIGLSRNTVLFIDSGAYELQTLGVKLGDWDKPLETFAYQLAVRGDVAVILDKPTYEPKLEMDKRKILEENIQAAKQVIKARSLQIPLMAVAHGYDEGSLLSQVRALASIDGISLIAISHKELSGIADDQLMRILFEAKKIIQSADRSKRLHVLAAGDMSLWSFYVAAGVSTFDSTKWIDGVAIPNEMRWSKGKDLPEERVCDCDICSKRKEILSEIAKNDESRLVHNLYCIEKAMAKIRRAMIDNTLTDLAEESHPKLYATLAADNEAKAMFENSGAL